MRTVRVVRRRRRVRRWVIVVLLGVALGGLGVYAYRLLSLSNTSFAELFRPPFEGRKFIRILALGEDNTNKSRSTGRGLSDTIMVAAVDLDAKTVRAISIPRDTRIEVSGHGAQKINAAYVFGGPELAKQAAETVLGVSIDYYIKTDIAGLKNIVDLVGGVGIDIEKNMYYRDRRGGLYINLKKGYRHLNGDKALQYVRFRHDVMGDITRIQRQQKFLRALARQMLAPGNWVRLPKLVGEIYSKGYVKTNLNLMDMRAIAKLTRDVPADSMEMDTAPGAPENIGGTSYWVVDAEKAAELVHRLLEYQQAQMASVEVLNGAGIGGLAKIVADRLEETGYQVTTTGNAPSFNYESSQVIVHNSKAQGADKIAEVIGCTDVRNQPTADGTAGPDVTVIVGRDCRR